MTEPDYGESVDTLRKNTAMYRLLPVLEHSIRNLNTALGKRAGMMFEQRGSGSAICVSAGPSLDSTIGWLRANQDNATVFAVNTAVGALLKNDIRPDVIVSTEHVDVSKGADLGECDRLVTVLSASPHVWNKADTWVVDPQPFSMSILAPMKVRPLYSCGNVAPTMVCLAHEWGADQVVLLGQDLACSDDGRAYASGTIWDKTKSKLNEDGSIDFEHMQNRQDAHEGAGCPRLPSKFGTLEVPAWDGGTVRTTADLLMQRDMIARHAVDYPRGEYINATGAGVRIEGWNHRPAETVTLRGGFPLPECERTTKAQVDAAYDAIERNADLAERLAKDELDNGGRDNVWLEVADGAQVLNAVCTPDWLRLNDIQGMDAKAAVDSRYTIIQAAAGWIRGHVQAVRG